MGELYAKRLKQQEWVKEVQARLTKAFRVLRHRHKMLARQRFMCCQSCAGSALAEEFRGKLDPEAFGGVVLTTKQTGVLIEPVPRRMGGGWPRIHDLWINFGKLEIDGEEFGPDTTEVGKLVAQVFDEVGVPYEWDGDPEKRIKVVPLAGRERV